MKSETKENLKKETLEIMSISLGFVAISILWGIGIGLISIENYWGIVPIIIGYELLRIIIKTLWKHIQK